MNEPQKKSYDLLESVTKQVLTIASGILAFTATLLKLENTATYWSIFIIICYLALFFSILAGIRVLYLLTIILSSIKSNNDDRVPIIIRHPSIRRAALIQHSTFFIGIISLGAFSLSHLPSYIALCS